MSITQLFKVGYGVPLLFSIIVIHLIIGGIPHYSILLYIGYILLGFLILSKGIIIRHEVLLYILYLGASVFISNPSPIFKSWQRLGLFILLLVCAGPLAKGNFVQLIKTKCLEYILYGCVLLSFGSFIAYFLGINYFENTYDGGYYTDFEGSAGLFSGLTAHSMLLGPISALASIYLINKIKVSFKSMLILIPCICSNLLSASRSSVFAMIVGMLVVILKRNSVLHSIRYIIITIVVLCLSFPLWNQFVEGIILKQELRNEATLGVFDSRTNKINYRISEFNNNPVFGVGLCAIDIEVGDEYNPNTGAIEPGSSWLAILSMTGLIGFAFFMYIYINCFKRVIITILR